MLPTGGCSNDLHLPWTTSCFRHSDGGVQTVVKQTGTLATWNFLPVARWCWVPRQTLGEPELKVVMTHTGTRAPDHQAEGLGWDTSKT